MVAELDPPDCTAETPATTWNSTLLDGITADFMAAVCGADAAAGECTHSVAAHAATMPAWVYKDAYPVPPGVLNPDPWEFNTFDAYNRGTALVRPLATNLCFLVLLLTHHSSSHLFPSYFSTLLPLLPCR